MQNISIPAPELFWVLLQSLEKMAKECADSYWEARSRSGHRSRSETFSGMILIHPHVSIEAVTSNNFREGRKHLSQLPARVFGSVLLHVGHGGMHESRGAGMAGGREGPQDGCDIARLGRGHQILQTYTES